MRTVGTDDGDEQMNMGRKEPLRGLGALKRTRTGLALPLSTCWSLPVRVRFSAPWRV